MSTIVAPSRRRSLRPAVAVIGGALAVFVITASGMGLLLGPLAVMGLCSLAIWRWPGWAAVAIAVLVPVNRFIILLVFSLTGSPMVTTLAKSWKDVFVTVLFARAMHDALTSGRRFRLRYLDILVAAFFLLSCAYLFYPGHGEQTGWLPRILGFRSDAYFMLAYYAGRNLRFERTHLRWLVLALVPVTLVVSAVAVGQVLKPDWFNRFFDMLDYREFVLGQGLAGDVDAIRQRGIGGLDLARASSLLLGDLALAVFQVFAVGVAAALCFRAEGARRTLSWGCFVVVMLATLTLTVTRSGMIVVVPMLLVMALVSRAFHRLAGIVVLCGIAASLALLASGLDAASLRALADPGEDSIQGHIRAAEQSIEIIRTTPLGLGLGTAGSIGQRFHGELAVTNENWYFQLATEMGVVAGFLYLVIVATAVAISIVNHGRVRDPSLKTIVLAVAGAGTGLLVMGLFLHAWEDSVLSMFFWLLAGIAVRAPELDADLAEAA